MSERGREWGASWTRRDTRRMLKLRRPPGRPRSTSPSFPLAARGPPPILPDAPFVCFVHVFPFMRLLGKLCNVRGSEWTDYIVTTSAPNRYYCAASLPRLKVESHEYALIMIPWHQALWVGQYRKIRQYYFTSLRGYCTFKTNGREETIGLLSNIQPSTRLLRDVEPKWARLALPKCQITQAGFAHRGK